MMRLPREPLYDLPHSFAADVKAFAQLAVRAAFFQVYSYELSVPIGQIHLLEIPHKTFFFNFVRIY